ncbi:HAD family hydrolase [Bacteroides acidifaciens]|jgi:haloacid dehalogenase superfamily, subfamily IA, variant 3 with third motif having DD or ED|uniref:HAD family hydrolase n=1 Tax=Bacteroides acidifaciens TaxID=85831 RepID=UPI001F5946C6|nr:HAD family hydrolase [Bacteroides acidifaciens]
MNTTKTIAALFDFDGVIMDTETQYTVFWNEQGLKHLNEEDFGRRIKGQTLTQIYEKYFPTLPEAQQEITAKLNVFEKQMFYEYIPGVEAFIADLHRHGVKIAVVTSSNEEKMQNVYNAHPEFKGMVDRILTGEMFARSKPAPDCFLLGMEIFSVTPENTYVFEDSFHGLQAGMTSGATVIGLATTNSAEAIAGKAHYVMNDFTAMTCDKLLTLHR